ncbi:MAG: hypothetical protein HY710_00785 [Candidatus Latescibacteria bacterium]|nr:hypothetical protein [Candidatus Latescibacterota bacterium]
MSYTTMWSYTWDLIEDGTDETIRRLRQDVGLEAISVATSYHTYEMLCCHRPGRKFLWAPESAVYFRPQTALYAETPIKPHLSPLARERDSLREVGDRCLAHGLKLVSWTVCLHNSHLATTYPDHAQSSAFGDVYLHALCPSSPAVRTYMIALARDLTTNYPIAAVELESLNFQGYGQSHYHGKYGLRFGPIESFLLSLCFCRHCSARAQARGIDASRLQESARQTFNQFCETDTPVNQSLDDYVRSQPELDAYVQLRADTVSSFVRELKAAIATPVYYLFMGDYYIGGIRYGEIAGIADRVEILTYTASPDRVRDGIASTLAHGIRPDQIVAGFQAYYPASPDQATLVHTTQAAFDQGVRGFSFYNYGIMPKKNLDWVNAAIEGIRA